MKCNLISEMPASYFSSKTPQCRALPTLYRKIFFWHFCSIFEFVFGMQKKIRTITWGRFLIWNFYLDIVWLKKVRSFQVLLESEIFPGVTAQLSPTWTNLFKSHHYTSPYMQCSWDAGQGSVRAREKNPLLADVRPGAEVVVSPGESPLNQMGKARPATDSSEPRAKRARQGSQVGFSPPSGVCTSQHWNQRDGCYQWWR